MLSGKLSGETLTLAGERPEEGSDRALRLELSLKRTGGVPGEQSLLAFYGPFVLCLLIVFFVPHDDLSIFWRLVSAALVAMCASIPGRMGHGMAVVFTIMAYTVMPIGARRWRARHEGLQRAIREADAREEQG